MNSAETLNKLSELLMKFVETTSARHEKNEASSNELATMIEASKVLVDVSIIRG